MCVSARNAALVFGVAIVAATYHLLSLPRTGIKTFDKTLSKLAVKTSAKDEVGGSFFHVELIPTPPYTPPYYQVNEVELYSCANRSLFPPAFQAALDSAYTPRLSTNMNMIIMGDSLGMQLAALFQDVSTDLSLKDDRCILELFPRDSNHDLYTLSQARGGGTIAGFRITDLLKRIGLTKPIPPMAGGSWRIEMAERMMNHSWALNNASASTESTRMLNASVVGSFDVLLFRIPQIWIALEEVRHEFLQETVELATKVFGVKTVIFVNLPLIKAYKEKSKFVETNKRIRAFVNQRQRHYQMPDNETSTNVFLLELGTLISSAAERNAQRLGYNTSETEFLTELVPNDPNKVPRPVAINCISRPVQEQPCPFNMIFYDGLHMCIETFGPRIVTGVECLVACAKFDPAEHHECDRTCNDQHMRFNWTT